MDSYQKYGYFHKKNCFKRSELEPIRDIVQRFHVGWLARNRKLYEESGVINSAYLTELSYMSATDRALMFEFIESPKILELLRPHLLQGVAFMNTQLFFAPFDPHKKNYWHRDIQYTDMPVSEQKAELAAVNVFHCRIPLFDEPGLELVPGTHKRWDTDEEFDVRMQTNGRNSYDDLPGTDKIELKAGDLLMFSANMVHRGLYAPNRLALDIIYCDPLPRLLKYAKKECLPNQQELAQLSPENPLAVTLSVLE